MVVVYEYGFIEIVKNPMVAMVNSWYIYKQE
jgi:hypothetical protein